MKFNFKTLVVLLVMSFVVVACSGATAPAAAPAAPAATEAPAAPAATEAPAAPAATEAPAAPAATEAPAEAPAATEAPAAPAATEAPAEAPACTSDAQDIMCALESDSSSSPMFSTLVALLKTSGMADLLKDPANPYTLFAPTNDAFEAYFASEGTSVEELSKPENVEALRKGLGMHLLPGKQMAADLAGMDYWTNTGTKIYVAVTDGMVVVDRDINVVAADVVVGNGVIHVIDGVIIGKE